MNSTLCATASATSSFASSSVNAIGFSQTTLMPCSRNALATAKWMWLGTVTMTKSILPFVRAPSSTAISWKSAYARSASIPSSFATWTVSDGRSETLPATSFARLFIAIAARCTGPMKDPGPPPICPYRRLAPVSFSLPSIMSLPPFQKSRYALVLVLHRSVQLTVFLIPLCILLASPRIWPVALGQFDPGACVRADRFRCQPCRAIGCPFIHERTPDIDAKVVRQHLAPRVRTRPSAYDAHTGHRRAQVPDTFGTFPQSKYYTLVDCTQDVALPMKRAESKEDPASIRVTMGRALPVQVWKEDDTVGAYRAAVHEFLDTSEGHPASKPVAVPVQRVRGR